MDIARGGSFAKGDKKVKAKTSTKDGEKKKEPQTKISRLTELAKSLYRNDFTRLVNVFCTAVSFQDIFVCTHRGLIRDTTLFIVAIVGFRLLAAELKAEPISAEPAAT